MPPTARRCWTPIHARVDLLDLERAGRRPVAANPGDTTYLCTADATGLAVSLIQSNASGFGTWLVEPITGINIHNRGLGFSLQPGHPAELAPGRRPPHTLCPAMATRDGALAAVFGTMGGDAQPQILLQIGARLFGAGSGVADAIAAGRWALQGAGSGFDTWTSGGAARRSRSRVRPPRTGAPGSLLAATWSPMHRRSTPGSGTPTPSSSSRAAPSPPPPIPRRRVGSAAGL